MAMIDNVSTAPCAWQSHTDPRTSLHSAFEFEIVAILEHRRRRHTHVQYRVNNPVTGVPWDLLNAPEWTTCGPSRLAVGIAWDTADYHNNGAGTPGLACP